MAQLFFFSAGSIGFALPLAGIQSVIQMIALQPPSVPARCQAGTINLHGSIIPVYSLRELAGLPARPPDLTDMLLIASAGETSVALWIDETRGIGEAEISPHPAGTDGTLPPGIAVTKNRIIVMTVLDRFLDAAGPGILAGTLKDLGITGETIAAETVAADIPEYGTVRAVLTGRAAKMVRPEPDTAPEKTTEILRFLLAYQQYGIEMDYVREVILTGEITPVPGAPDFISGICVVRGQIISLVDLRVLFRIPEKGLTDLNRVIVMTNGKLTFGILADTISGVGTIATDRIHAPRPDDLPGGQRYLKGVIDDNTFVIDAGAILRDPSIIIDDS